jgi:hypothetical protein
MKKFLWTICSISYLFISPTSFAGKIEEAEIHWFMAWAQKNKSTEWAALGDIHPAFKVAKLAAEEANRDVPPVIKVKMMRIISSALRGIGFGGISKARQATAEERLAARDVASIFGQFTTADSGSFVDAAGDADEAAHYGVVDQLVQAGRHREPAWRSAEKMEEHYRKTYGEFGYYKPYKDQPLTNLMTFRFHNYGPERQASTSILMRCVSWDDIPNMISSNSNLKGVYLLSDYSNTISGSVGTQYYNNFNGQAGFTGLDGENIGDSDEEYSNSIMGKLGEKFGSLRIVRTGTKGSESTRTKLADAEIPAAMEYVVGNGGAFGLITHLGDMADRSEFYDEFPEAIGPKLSDSGAWNKVIGNDFAHYDGKGIIVSSTHKGQTTDERCKGKFLKSFVQEHNGLPDAELVVFIDDTLEQDISVYENLTSIGIPVISCFYAPIMTPAEARVAYAKDPKTMVAKPKPTVRRKWQPAGRSASTGMGSGAGSVSGWPTSRHSVTTPLKPPFAR